MKTQGLIAIAVAGLLGAPANSAPEQQNARSTATATAPAKVVVKGLAGGPNVLFYEDFVIGTSAYQAALDALGWSHTDVTDPSEFETELQAGGYTHVIAAQQNSGGLSVWEDDLLDWAQANPDGVIVISDWRVIEGISYLAELGFGYTGNTNLGLVEGVGGEVLDGLAGALINPGWGIFSYGVTGGTTIATDAPGSGKPMAVRNGCHFFNGFLSDTFLNAAVGREVAMRELQCKAGGGVFELVGVSGDGSPTPESLFRISTDDASIEFICGLGRGDDGETIGWNSTDNQLYHASGHDEPFDPKSLDGVIFEVVDGIGNGTSCTTTDIDISTTVLVDEEAQALVWWPEENVFLWKQNHGTGPLFRVTTAGEPTLVGKMDHQAKGLAFAQIPAGVAGGGTGLYSVARDGDQLRLIDPTDASTIDEITMTLTAGVGEIIGANGLATHPGTGELWVVIRVEVPDGKGGPQRLLGVVDPASGGVDVVGPLEEAFAGLAFVGTGDAPVCPPVNLVVVMDTSGSMDDEAAALCETIDDVIAALADQGIDVTATLLGITEDGDDDPDFFCLTDNVLDLLGPAVPRTDDILDDTEDWGPAAAIVADRFAWGDDRLRLLVTISDEDPQDGDGCNPGDDAAIENAIAQALENGVIVSTIVAQLDKGACDGDDCSCITPLAQALANATGGVSFQSVDPGGDIEQAFVNIVLAACGFTGDCNNNGIPDDVETMPLYQLDEDAQATPDCEDAPYIGPGLTYVSTTTTDGSLGPALPDLFFCGLYVGVIDVFYQYTPAWDGLAFVSVEGPPIDFVYGVYDACPPTRESLVDCNEIDHFEIIFHAEKGTTYWIRIAAQYFQEGPFELHMIGPDPAFNPVDCNGNGIPDECECLADVDGDGFITSVDVARIVAMMGQSCTGCPEDVDGDGEVDMTDLQIVLQQLGEACPFGDGGT